MAALSRRAARPFLICLLLSQRGCRAHVKKQQPSTLLGSYPHVLQNSLRNLSSEADVAATVATWKATGQTLGGFYIDECYYHQLLRPFLEATKGQGISIFGMLRSHNGAIYCTAVYGASAANSSAPAISGQEMNWTRVATTLATLSAEFPHFVGYTIDDFYCMMQDPTAPADQFGGPVPRLSVPDLARAHAAMKAIAPHFMFMPTVYPGYLGVVAGPSGFTLGIGPELPFDTHTSASVTFTLPSAAHHTGEVAFMLASPFASWDRGSYANPVWRGKMFVRSKFLLRNGTEMVVLDVDLFSLVGCGSSTTSISHCIPQEMMRVCGRVPADTTWTAVTIELYAKDQVNLNYYNSKLVTIWNVSVSADGQIQPTLNVSFAKQESPATFQNRSNAGKVQAHDNANFSIRATADGMPASDGLLFPFAANGLATYTRDSYQMLLSLAADATQGHGQKLWALHYGWMWRGAFSGMGEADAHALSRMIDWDRQHNVDAIVIWGLRMEASNIPAQRGIFTQRRAAAATLTAAQNQGFREPAVSILESVHID
jgi:hypothetical protein